MGRMLRLRSPLVAAALVLTGAAAAQDEVLYYKFDAGPGADRVLNFAPPRSPAPGEGRVVSNAMVVAWAPGRFAFGLAGLTHLSPSFARVESGWAPSVNGDFTYACFLRFGWANPTPTLSHILGVPTTNGFRAFVNGSRLETAGVDGSTTTYATNADIWQLALAGWVHVAFVVDTNRSTATYYVNGVADARLPLAGAAQIVAPDFWVGQHLGTQPGSVFDLDEVRVLTRAATPLEIQTWARESTAASAEFGAGCGARLIDSSGPPTLGNGSYALLFAAQVNAFGVLAIGGSRHWLGALPLPLDLGLVLPPLRGCFWQSSSEVTFGVNLDAHGGGAFGLGIPNVASLLYRPIFVQALFSDVASEASTNALAISIGR